MPSRHHLIGAQAVNVWHHKSAALPCLDELLPEGFRIGIPGECPQGIAIIGQVGLFFYHGIRVFFQQAAPEFSTQGIDLDLIQKVFIEGMAWNGR